MHIGFFDGACRGNPGPSSYGTVILDNALNEVHNDKRYIGTATNNEAEYSGLINLLECAIEKGIQSIAIKGDSLLVIRQMTKVYAVRKENLTPLYRKAVELSKKIRHVHFTHVPREQNKRADELANQALDEAQKQN